MFNSVQKYKKLEKKTSEDTQTYLNVNKMAEDTRQFKGNGKIIFR